ncbi:hypothetical protein KZ820_20425 [Sphingomonas sp. RRHST34]|jgi:hypothetical protein|uniref:Uncharacterized protein n=1 Tax=Sphingomonas citri TaxID=2862499 RepID=A0ABS7BU34_9SPHN|nr:hypothetical protein [Sphingomonas citri]MBW6533117.1 hypothetical protein [Sphingomonas citri]
MLRASVAMAMVALLAAAPAAAKRKSPDAELAELLKGRTAEPAVRCITPTTNDSQRIISGKGIVYGNGRRIWVNVPIGRLDTMRWDDVLVTERFGGQLCRNDQIRVVDRFSRVPRPILRLGEFVPYVKGSARR